MEKFQPALRPTHPAPSSGQLLGIFGRSATRPWPRICKCYVLFWEIKDAWKQIKTLFSRGWKTNLFAKVVERRGWNDARSGRQRTWETKMSAIRFSSPPWSSLSITAPRPMLMLQASTVTDLQSLSCLQCSAFSYCSSSCKAAVSESPSLSTHRAWTIVLYVMTRTLGTLS